MIWWPLLRKINCGILGRVLHARIPYLWRYLDSKCWRFTFLWAGKWILENLFSNACQMEIKQLALIFTTAKLTSTLICLTRVVCSCLFTSSAYHCWNLAFIPSFTGLFTDKSNGWSLLCSWVATGWIQYFWKLVVNECY